jgi:hypothetical protein
LRGQGVIANIGRALSWEWAIGSIYLLGNTPMRASGISPATVSAVRCAGMRSAGERAECRKHLRPPQMPRPARGVHAARFRTLLGPTLVRLVDHVIARDRRCRDRRLLAILDAEGSGDIGIDRTTAETDSAMSFWRWR